MSKVKIQGNASGTGVVTLTAPNTNTDRTITLPDDTQTLIGTNASGNVGIGTASPTVALELGSVKAQRWQTGSTTLDLTPTSGGTDQFVFNASQDTFIDFKMGGTTKTSITTNGITFNGDTAAANALDDYETGTFDADIKDDTGVVMASTSGFYVKVGKLVKCRIQIYINSVTASTFTGAPYITIPFVPYASTSAGFYPQYNNGLATINSGYISGGIGNLYLTTNRDEPYGSIATGGSYGGSVRLYGEFSYIAN